MNESNGTVAALDAPIVDDVDMIDNVDPVDPVDNVDICDDVFSEGSRAVLVDSEEAVLSEVDRSNEQFELNALAARYHEFAKAAKAFADPLSAGPKMLCLGALIDQLMVDTRQLKDITYDRRSVLDNCKTACRIAGLSEGWIERIGEIVQVYWFVKLCRSIPADDPSKDRSFADGEAPDDWFGGNLTLDAVRTLMPAILRVSKKSEIERWEFKDRYEHHVRDWVQRLRKGSLAIAQVRALVSARKLHIIKEDRNARFSGMLPDEIKSIEDSEANKSRERELVKLGSMALDIQEHAANLKKGKAELAAFLIEKQVIPPSKPLSMVELADKITPGEMKQLVQGLFADSCKNPKSVEVFGVLKATISAIEKLATESANTQQRRSA